jgi:ATP synthase protein I
LAETRTTGEPEEPLKELGRRLDAARRAQQAGVRPGKQQAVPSFGSGLALAWRVGIELVAAIAVGTGLGWAFDRWLGTAPWGMIVMFFLGVAAGMLNVWRAVTGQGMAVGYHRPPEQSAAKTDWDDED